jgi:biopolymer transport protein ExbD
MPRVRFKFGPESYTRSPRPEPDLTSLINIVFLILIFFIVAGTLRPFSARGLKLASAENNTVQTATPSTLIAHTDGRITYAGHAVDIVQLAAEVRGKSQINKSKTFSIVADGRLPGPQLLAISRALREAGVGSVSVMVERGRK